jgi:hypothetical protein
VGSERVSDLGSRSFSLLRGFYGEERDRLMSIFLDSFGETLRTVPGCVPWFVSKDMGGLGLAQTREKTLSVDQKKYVRYIDSLRDEDMPGPFDAFREERSVLDIKPIGQKVQFYVDCSTTSQSDMSSSWLGFLKFRLPRDGEDKPAMPKTAEALWSIVRKYFDVAKQCVRRHDVLFDRPSNYVDFNMERCVSFFTSPVKLVGNYPL